MAKVKHPLHSKGARGQLAKDVVFGEWKGIKYGKEYTVPSNPRTPDQVSQRSKFKRAVEVYRTLTQAQKDAWDAYAERRNAAMSGFNWFVKLAIEALRANKAINVNPPA